MRNDRQQEQLKPFNLFSSPGFRSLAQACILTLWLFQTSAGWIADLLLSLVVFRREACRRFAPVSRFPSFTQLAHHVLLPPPAFSHSELNSSKALAFPSHTCWSHMWVFPRLVCKDFSWDGPLTSDWSSWISSFISARFLNCEKCPQPPLMLR